MPEFKEFPHVSRSGLGKEHEIEALGIRTKLLIFLQVTAESDVFPGICGVSRVVLLFLDASKLPACLNNAPSLHPSGSLDADDVISSQSS